MAMNKTIPSLIVGACVALLAACAAQSSAPEVKAATPAVAVATPAPAATVAQTESQTATAMEKKFQEAARGYKTIQRDGKTLYCKREKVISSTIPTLQCLTESQLRNQVETMEDLRQRMRSNGKCPMGPQGCSG